MLNTELETAVLLARGAGAIILEFYKNGVVAEEKIGVDNFVEAVTEADRAASRFIMAGLHKAFPDDFVLSEEESDEPSVRLSKSRVWMVDPLDGTLGFIRRDHDFAVQIGLTEAGKAIAGVVYLPVENILYFGSRGRGSFRVGEDGETTRLTVTDNSVVETFNLAVSRNHRSPKMEMLKQQLGIEHETQRGSVGLKVGLLAEQTCDLYIHLSPRTKYWDTCAPQIILEEAGGKLTDIFGGAFDYNLADVQNHNGILASNGAVHDGIIRKLKPILSHLGRFRVVSSRTA
jgi:3'(2'), 5'-bisphosphate nucleotidase